MKSYVEASRLLRIAITEGRLPVRVAEILLAGLEACARGDTLKGCEAIRAASYKGSVAQARAALENAARLLYGGAPFERATERTERDSNGEVEPIDGRRRV